MVRCRRGQLMVWGSALRTISTQKNKHGIGPDRNKIETAHWLSVVPISCSSLNLWSATWMIKSWSIFNFFWSSDVDNTRLKEVQSDPIRWLFSWVETGLYLDSGPYHVGMYTYIHTKLYLLTLAPTTISRLISMGGVKYTINYLQKIRKYKKKIKVRLHYWKTWWTKNTEILKNTKRMYKSKFQLILCFNNVLKELKDSAIFAW